MMCNGEKLQISPRLPKEKKCARPIVYLFSCQLCFSERERASVVMWVFDVFGVICFVLCFDMLDVCVYICIYIYIYVYIT